MRRFRRIKKWCASAAVLYALLQGRDVFAQTATPTPAPTETPTPAPWLYATLAPVSPATEGQMTRIDFVVSPTDVHIANLLTFILLSLWGMFFFCVIGLTAMRKK